MTNPNLNIVSWNCRSIYPRLSEFKIYLYKTQPHIVCLNETWIYQERSPSFINYKCYFNNRTTSSGGGLLILVRSDLNSLRFDITPYNQGKLEIQGVNIFILRQKYNIINIYNPNEVVSKEEYSHYINQLGNNFIMCGDFNARHPLWDTRRPPNTSGLNLAEAIVDFDCVLLTRQNLPTYFHAQTNAFSTLDLAFVPSHIYIIAQTFLEDDIYSDHYPVIIQIALSPDIAPLKRRQKWIFNQNWDEWKAHLPDLTHIGDPEADNQQLTETIIATGLDYFKLTKKEVTVKYSKPWWTDECAAAVRDKHRAKNHFHRHPTIENYQEFKQKEKTCSDVIYKAKQQSFRSFISTITEDTPVKELWRRISSLSGKFKPPARAPIIKNGEIYTNPQDKARLIAEAYKNAFNTKCRSPIAQSLLLPIATSAMEGDEEPYNKPIQEYEVREAIKSLKLNSPGTDMVHNAFLKNLPDHHIQLLTKLFNDSFSQSTMPQAWKIALIYPILKPGKDPTDPDSQRPISLMSCIGKLLEKIICKRLTFILEKSGALSQTQGGFRNKMSTLDQLARVEAAARYALATKQYCLLVCIDLSKAYDIVWHTGLLYKLQ